MSVHTIRDLLVIVMMLEICIILLTVTAAMLEYELLKRKNRL